MRAVTKNRLRPTENTLILNISQAKNARHFFSLLRKPLKSIMGYTYRQRGIMLRESHTLDVK